MLIRVRGYNAGIQEYLEEGIKSGREFTRDELDQRIILDGDLDLTRQVYESIGDKGQDRYLSITLAFREDDISHDTLHEVAQEFKQFMMHAYKEEEFNYYAEAHIPKIKTIKDNATGEMIERKPHIHIVIPKKNLLSGQIFDPVGSSYLQSEKHLEAFQEYINQKYNLASPRDHVRVDIKDAASVLSRYKGDDFYGKNREFKQGLVKQVIERGIVTRQDFYALVAEHGDTRIRNEGKPNEYIAVKLPGDAKSTNLKDTIFQDDFIVRRELKKPPLEKKVIQERLLQWPQRAKEIKYISKAGPKFRKFYTDSSPDARGRLLAEREQTFYQTYGDRFGDVPAPQRGGKQRRVIEAGRPGPSHAAPAVQGVSVIDVAVHGPDRSAEAVEDPLFQPIDTPIPLGQPPPGADSRLRPPIRAGGGKNRSKPRRPVTPPYPRNPHRVNRLSDIEARSELLFGPLKRAEQSQAFQDHPLRLTAEGEKKLLQTHGGRYDGLHAPERERDHQRSVIETEGRGPGRVTHGLQDVSVSDVAADGQGRSAEQSDGALLLHLDAHVHLGQSPKGGNSRLRPLVRTGGGRGGASGRRQQPAGLSQTTDGRTTTTRAGGNTQLHQSRRTVTPTYPRNPHRVNSISDIETRSERLFAPLKRALDSELTIKRAKHKPLSINREASTVAAYFNRQFENDQLLPPQRKALRRVNHQFFELRRWVFSDSRLTRRDKTQLVSVLMFERMKAREAIKNPNANIEVNFMGSAEIRRLIVEEEKEERGFTISGPLGPRPVGMREQVHRIVENLGKHLDPNKARERELSSKDIYTRKARFSQNVHYRDKNTDKTLFVDTGKGISMRRTGITESSVAIALKLAQDRFGSTLTITGSPAFKQMVVEAAAKNGMDLHFTDKDMNESLAARRIELEIEAESQSIEPSTSEPSPDTAQAQVEPEQATQPQAPAAPSFVHNNQPVTLDLSRYPGQSQPAATDLPQSNSAFMQREAAWRQSMQLPGREVMTEEQVRASDSVMAVRGEDHALWLVNTHDKSPEAVTMISAYLENDSYRDSFKRVIEDFYAVAQDSPEALQSLDVATDFVEPLVQEIERKKYEAALAGEGKPDASKPAKPASDRKLIQGELIDHGEAPYRNLPDKEQSYFVTVKTDAGNRTLWGVGLASAMEEAGAIPGDRVQIEDQGTVPVTVQERQADGSVLEKPSFRREWAVERETIEQEGPMALDEAPTAERAAGPGPLTFTHGGQPASLGLRPVELQEEAATAAAPLTSTEPEEDYGPEMG